MSSFLDFSLMHAGGRGWGVSVPPMPHHTEHGIAGVP